MTELLKEARPVARKPHRCYECGRTIQPGETYVSQFIVDYGDHWTWKGCEQCSWLLHLVVFSDPNYDGDNFDFRDAFTEWVHGLGPGWRFEGSPMRRVDRPGDVTAWLAGARLHAWWRRRWLDRNNAPISLDTLRVLAASLNRSNVGDAP